MDIDNSVIYSLCRRHNLLNFYKFHFLFVILKMHFSEKSPVRIGRIWKGPMAINRLRNSTLAECKVNTYEHKRNWIHEKKQPARTGVFWKCTEISNGITFAITHHNNYHGDMPLIVVSFVKRVMELIVLICNYWMYC
jgi:hypothetical protein